MKVLTVFANPSPKSFCHAILKQFTKGLEDAGHTSEVVDLYAIRFNPVFRTQDFASYAHESMPRELLDDVLHGPCGQYPLGKNKERGTSDILLIG
jgi:NAD(P)H dehydrogenase (quinone)